MTGRWHWLLPLALVLFGVAAFGAIPGAQGPFGTVTPQSAGDLAVGFGAVGLALGYCIGRVVALRRRTP